MGGGFVGVGKGEVGSVGVGSGEVGSVGVGSGEVGSVGVGGGEMGENGTSARRPVSSLGGCGSRASREAARWPGSQATNRKTMRQANRLAKDRLKRMIFTPFPPAGCAKAELSYPLLQDQGQVRLTGSVAVAVYHAWRKLFEAQCTPRAWPGREPVHLCSGVVYVPLVPGSLCHCVTVPLSCCALSGGGPYFGGGMVRRRGSTACRVAVPALAGAPGVRPPWGTFPVVAIVTQRFAGYKLS
jgi:hypothetical protein